ncbi:MAG TPA: peptide chain release factor 3 [Firmicutes bacterium]|nr:peptide chain release factor 3 [Bacillota bacterium]
MEGGIAPLAHVRTATQAKQRRTFAIISHPDAGKTTLTEKLLLYGGAIHLAGAVKSRKAQRYATSDWMELEKQRGISVTTSVLQFDYAGYAINLLDTPGHQDFSEDTYRTLTAVDSAVMLIDAAKGVEEQTRKLFQVCRMRGVPIFTFINKLDRFGRVPLDLLAELEEVLGIRSTPMNWPIGMGSDFQGIYDRYKRRIELFAGVGHGEDKAPAYYVELGDPAVDSLIGSAAHAQLAEEIDLLDVAGDEFDIDRVLAGELTPVYFGSALNNFGVQSFLESFLSMAPAPQGRQADTGWVAPDAEDFAAFVFKIQANMNPAHRDRMAFLRIVSGRFTRGMSAHHARLGKKVRLSQPQQFMAQERTIIEEAYPGDIIGIFDPGIFQIGDTLTTGAPLRFQGIPYFSPEQFAFIRLNDAMKRKQLVKGLDQLAQEGAVQLFRPVGWGTTDTIVGAVGTLQFDVMAYRLKHEYGVDAAMVPMPYTLARWVEGPADPQRLTNSDSTCVLDRAGRIAVLFKSEWALRWAEKNFPKLNFHSTAEVVDNEAEWVVGMR